MNAKHLSPIQFIILVAIAATAAMLSAGAILDNQTSRAMAERVRSGRAELCYRIPAGTWIPLRLEVQMKQDCASQLFEQGYIDGTP